MFNPTQVVIQAFVHELKDMYGQIYGVLEPAYPDIIGFVGRLSLENIANSDAAYHDMNHTIMVTLVGQAYVGATATDIMSVMRKAISCRYRQARPMHP